MSTSDRTISLDGVALLNVFAHGQKVSMTHFRYVGMSRAYTNGLATELNAANHTPGKRMKTTKINGVNLNSVFFA